MIVNTKTLATAIRLAERMTKKVVSPTQLPTILTFNYNSVSIKNIHFTIQVPSEPSHEFSECLKFAVDIKDVKTLLSITEDEFLELKRTREHGSDGYQNKMVFGDLSIKETLEDAYSDKLTDVSSLKEVEVNIEAAKKVQLFLSNDSARGTITEMLVSGNEYVGTDGHTLAVVDAVTNTYDKPYLVLPELVEGICNADSAKMFIDGVDVKCLEIQIKEDMFKVFTDELSSNADNYPNFKHVLPKKQSFEMKVLPTAPKEAKNQQKKFKKLKIGMENMTVRFNEDYSVDMVSGYSDTGIELNAKFKSLEAINPHKPNTPFKVSVNHTYFFERLFETLDLDKLHNGDYIFGVSDYMTPVTVTDGKDTFVVMPMRF